MTTEPKYEPAEDRVETGRRATNFRMGRAALEAQILDELGLLLRTHRVGELPDKSQLGAWYQLPNDLFPSPTFDRFRVWEILNRPLTLVTRPPVEW